MNIKTAITLRHPRIRMPQWHPGAYLRLPLLPNGRSGVWADLYDEPAQLSLGIPVGSQQLFVNDPEVAAECGYEVYEGPPNPAEQPAL